VIRETRPSNGEWLYQYVKQPADVQSDPLLTKKYPENGKTKSMKPRG
jgi:hypothetical protein